MFWTACLVLLILWLLGLLAGAGPWVQVMPAMALALLLYRLLMGARRG